MRRKSRKSRKDGDSSMENLITSCEECNLGKGVEYHGS